MRDPKILSFKIHFQEEKKTVSGSNYLENCTQLYPLKFKVVCKSNTLYNSIIEKSRFCGLCEDISRCRVRASLFLPKIFDGCITYPHYDRAINWRQE